MSTLLTDARAGVMVPNRRDQFCPPLVRKERALDCCFSPRSEVRQPDPAIYSQLEILKRDGLTARPSWQSPDIATNLLGMWALLMPEAQITVHNLSAVASAAGVRVDVFVFRFGIGYPRELIGGSEVSIAPSGRTTFLAAFPQKIFTGDRLIGVEVRITHSTDANVENNVGLHAYETFYTSDVGRQFQFTFLVRNPSALPQLVEMKVENDGLFIDSSATNFARFSPFEERPYISNLTVSPMLAAPSRREVKFMAFGENGQFIDGLSLVVNVDA